MEAYKTETIEQHGKTYRIQWVHDSDAGMPWENSDGHGIVTEWTRRDKKPGELILNSDRGSHRFYDFAASVKIAKRDGWNTAPYDWKTKGEQAHQAAMADFEYLRRFCADQWHYCGIIVTLLDDEGEETNYSDAIWGVEDDGHNSTGYHASIIQDCIGNVDYLENKAAFPVATMGV